MIMNFTGLLAASIALFIILDPFLSSAVFVGMMKRATRRQINSGAFVASGVAFSLLVAFLLIGDPLLNYLGIDFGSFKVAGGIILLIMGVEQVLGLEFKKSHESFKTAVVVIGTPLLAGPGALSTVLIFEQQYGFWIPFIAVALVCALTYIILDFSHLVHKLVGAQLIEIASRVMGLLLAGLAVTYIKQGIMLIVSGA